jgi:hypothetical protein
MLIMRNTNRNEAMATDALPTSSCFTTLHFGTFTEEIPAGATVVVAFFKVLGLSRWYIPLWENRN